MNIKSVYKLSEEVVARDIQGELIIIPITSGVGNLEDEIFTLNETGRAIWDEMDGKKSIKDVVDELVQKFDGPREQVEKDVLGLNGELLKRKMIVQVNK
jgi:hypothetical protein